jgi:lipid-binding SYLF domain-containing protein
MKSVLISLMLVVPAFAQKDVDEHTKRIQESATVLNEIMGAGDNGIPQDILAQAQCIGIVPNLKRAGFIVGAKYGKGVLTCRTAGSPGWSPVSTIRIEGGSVGLQIGAGETDVVFAVMNQRGMDKLMTDKFTLGADASVMAGPVGRSAAAQTDAQLHAEILGWSRSRGAFAGISLEGATLRPDNEDNEKIYHQAVTQEKLLHGSGLKAPAAANQLYSELNRYAPASPKR